ncbi:DUF2460 domain-containing protein [Poseidonocella sp. HB161398]|uniref:DUF2460 domain-containing protein n=1 Tax=Poseidonocella sp. HB161398 TaxID=2320855 RepID=UPI0011081A74|nr:DUF2460 domain-containing protein [Poseidonocella sp. HB161398]
MAHLDLDFPRDVAQGCQSIRERRTDVVTLESGHEERNQRWAHARRSWQAGLGIRRADDLDDVVALWEQAAGARHSFRFRDWTDWRSGLPSEPVTPLDQPLGTGDGSAVTFQVVKVYGALQPYARPVALPSLASLRIAVDGAELTSGWSLSATGGRVTFDSAPAPGAVLTCGFTYAMPVRFGDTLTIDAAFFRSSGAGIASAPDIPLMEVRLD